MGKIRYTRTVYVFQAIYLYESSIAIFAYEKEEDAKAFIEQCNEYARANPKPVDPIKYLTMEERSEAIENKYEEDMKVWVEHHPVGKEYADADRFVVKPLSVIGFKDSAEGDLCENDPFGRDAGALRF